MTEIDEPLGIARRAKAEGRVRDWQTAKAARGLAKTDLKEGQRIGEFYAGWNAAIKAIQAMAQTQGWWFPDSALKLMVDPDGRN